jgi:hypothetical protein
LKPTNRMFLASGGSPTFGACADEGAADTTNAPMIKMQTRLTKPMISSF